MKNPWLFLILGLIIGTFVGFQAGQSPPIELPTAIGTDDGENTISASTESNEVDRTETVLNQAGQMINEGRYEQAVTALISLRDERAISLLESAMRASIKPILENIGRNLSAKNYDKAREQLRALVISRLKISDSIRTSTVLRLLESVQDVPNEEFETKRVFYQFLSQLAPEKREFGEKAKEYASLSSQKAQQIGATALSAMRMK